MDRIRVADAAGVGEALEARGDINALAVDLFAIHHHVAEVDADAELRPALGWEICVLSLERGLNLDGALDFTMLANPGRTLSPAELTKRP